MALHLLIAYLVLNLAVAVFLHLRTLQRTLYTPKPNEVVIYFLVMLVIGTPFAVVKLLFNHGSDLED